MKVLNLAQLFDRSNSLKTTSGISSSVERALWERDAVGSIPTSPTIYLCSSVVEQAVDNRSVNDSSPFAGTIFRHRQRSQRLDGKVIPLRCGETGITCDFDSHVPGSYPGISELCPGSNGKTPGCDPGNAVSRSAGHPICALSKDSNATGCNPVMQPCKSASVLHVLVAQCRGNGFKPRLVRTQTPPRVPMLPYSKSRESGFRPRPVRVQDSQGVPHPCTPTQSELT